MKVVIVDNFDRDYVSERLHAKNLSEEEAEREAERMNNKETSFCSQKYYVVRSDDYKLYEFEP